MQQEDSEDRYIKRITFFVFLCVQTVLIALFILSDHFELRELIRKVESIEKAQDAIQANLQALNVARESSSEFRMWVGKVLEVSIADRASLRADIVKLGEIKYDLQQCTNEIKDLEETFKEHQKATSAGSRAQ